MHISYESGILENPLNEPKEEMFAWTRSLESKLQTLESKLTKNLDSKALLANVSDFLDAVRPTDVEIRLINGIPIKLTVNGSNKAIEDSVEIMKTLNDIGAKHGVGRIDIVSIYF